MQERKLISEVVQEFGSAELEGSIDSVIQKLQQIYAKYKPDSTSVTLKGEYGYEGLDYYQVLIERYENDEEFNKRIIAAEKAKARRDAKAAEQLAKDEAEFERLRKKLGK